MAPDTYGEILARNIRAARSRLGIGQDRVAVRMRALGYDAWIRQTVSATERGRRRPGAEEIFALAFVLQTTIAFLMAPRDEDKVVDFPNGQQVPARPVQLSALGHLADVVWWDDDKPVVGRRQAPGEPDDVLSRAALESWRLAGAARPPEHGA